MYSTILVPLDGLPRAENILPHVKQLAQRHHSKVILLQVIEPQRHPVSADIALPGQEVLERYTEEATKYLALQRGRLTEVGIETDVLVEHSPVVEGIAKVAEHENVDLIAMVSSRLGVSQVIYGSVAVQLF